MRTVDWRDESASFVAPLLAREMRAWREELHWDLTEAWASIEPARTSGRLAGALAIDAAGIVQGWTCFLLHRDALQVASFVSHDAETTHALVEAIDRSDEAARASTRVWFVRATAPGLETAIAGSGLAIGSYEYRVAEPARMQADRVDASMRPWRATDRRAVAVLCERAYAGATDVRAFAPGGTPGEWREYVDGLVAGVSCGSLLPGASFAIEATDGTPEAAIITTSLAPGTAHIAQVVVAPDARGRGVGRALVEAAATRARALGFGELSLLVSQTNATAMRLYDRLGFERRGVFLAAATARRGRELRASA